MKVQVVRVCDSTQGIVAFSSEVGSAIGRWMGRGEARIGEFYVEIEIPEEVDEWRRATTVEANSISSNSTDEPDVNITAEVIGVGEGDDRVVDLRLGTAVLMIEVANGGNTPAVGDVITFRTVDLQLYPFSL